MTRFRTSTAEGAGQTRLPTHTLFLLLLVLPVATACRKSDTAAKDTNATLGEVVPDAPPSTMPGSETARPVTALAQDPQDPNGVIVGLGQSGVLFVRASPARSATP
jgi:hypothetical protein